MTGIALQIAIAAIPAIFAIVLHELGHGYAAWALGDDTAKRAGRLSLNPLRHVDPIGTVLLPGMLVLMQLATLHHVAFMFGWAKPVPISSWRFRDERHMMMLVAAAGPLTNFVLAWLSALALHGVGVLPPVPGAVAGAMLQLFILYNLALGLFNLLPIPPFDGGRIMVGLLPASLAAFWARLEPIGLFAVILLLFLLPQLLHEAGIAFDPLRDGLGRALPWAFDLVLRLAGHPDVGS
ncbi:MAG TPA: site-2 protease family protein [Acetobacteraceae bacterium]|nr:site-2 protease family protein [Acetobacteraceae bacterium]